MAMMPAVTLYAKRYTEDNPLVKGEPPFLVAKFKSDALEEALRQLQAAPAPMKVEWHVSNKKAVDVLARLFADSNLPGKERMVVVFTPDIVN